MVTFLITLVVLLFINLFLFTFSVNRPEKKVKDLAIEKNEKIIAHTQRFIPDVEHNNAIIPKNNKSNSATKQSEPVSVS